MIYLAILLSVSTIVLAILFILKGKFKKQKTTKVDIEVVDDIEEAGESSRNSYIQAPYYASNFAYDQNDLRQRSTTSHMAQYYQSYQAVHGSPSQQQTTNSEVITHVNESNSIQLPRPSASPIQPHGVVKKLTPMSPMIPMPPLQNNQTTPDGNKSNKSSNIVPVYKATVTLPSRRNRPYSPNKLSPVKSTKLQTLHELDTDTSLQHHHQYNETEHLNMMEQNPHNNQNNSNPSLSPPSSSSTMTGSPGLKNSAPLVHLKFFTYYSEGGNTDTDHSSSSSSYKNNNTHTTQLYAKTVITKQGDPHTIQTPAPAVPIPTAADNDNALNTISITELTLERKVGGGGFGEVWLGKWRGTPVAVKILTMLSNPNSSSNQQGVGVGVDAVVDAEAKKLVDSFHDEVLMLSKLRHPNICLFMGASYDPHTSSRAIITEYVSRGSLWDALRVPKTVLFADGHSTGGGHSYTPRPPTGADNGLYWPNWAIQKVLRGTCMGLIYLHSHRPSPIIHRDLKSPNLLLTDSFDIKVSSFIYLHSISLSIYYYYDVILYQYMCVCRYVILVLQSYAACQ